MKETKSLGRYALLMAAGLSLAGCSGWSFKPPIDGNPITEPYNVSAVQSAAPQGGGGNFDQALTGEYANLATALANQQGDLVDADYFARKGLAVASGEAAPPEVNTNWLIPLEVPRHYRTELADARKRLVTALDAGGRQGKPAVAARAQARYDCWVERMEDSWATAENGACKKDFLAAMDELEGKNVTAPQPPAAAQPAPTLPLREYRVYFEFDKSNLLPAAQQIVQHVGQAAKEDPNLRVVLVGKADRAGPASYNLRLSKRRADTVRQALQQNGVPGNRIEESWVGETQPPVPTPDGVREPRNRVVEIDLR